MAVFDQMKTTYNNDGSTGDSHDITVRIVSDAIRMIDPVDTPLVVALGGLDAARSKFQVRQNGKKIELLEDEYGATAGAFAAGGATTLTAGDTQFTVADASILQPGSVILFGTEYAWVSAVNNSTNVITMSRTVGGTNDTAESTEAFSIVGMARLEGDDADYIGLNEVATVYNYTGIVQKALSVSGSDEAIDYYGMGSPFAYQAAKAVPELTRLIELQLFHGFRAAGSASVARNWGGLGTFIGSNTQAASGAIAKSHVDDLMKAIYIDGGQPDILVVHPSIAQDLKDLIDSSSFVRIDQNENKLGLGPLQYAQTQYGNLRILMDRWCPVATAYVLDTRKAGLFTLRPFGWKPLAVTGDSKKGEVLGEFSFLMANNEAHGTITGITTS
jgi:hypothetical protein